MKKTSALFIKRIVALTMVTLLICTLFLIPVSADDTIIANLLPSNNEENGKLTLDGCTLEENDDGSITFTLTKATATFKMVFAESFYAEGKGGTIYNDSPIDISKPAFVVYDYASADGVKMSEVIAHYTRKDKAPDNKLADLWLTSMEDPKYAEYSEVSGEGYGVWDWAKYVNASKEKKVFDDNIHRFCDLTGNLAGTVGSKITLYSFYVSSTKDVKDLGKVRPEPTKQETSSEEPAEESSVAPTEDNSEESEISEESEASSEDTSSEISKEESTVSAEQSEQESSETDTDESDGTSPLIYIAIIAGALIIIGLIIYFAKKNKK